MKMLSTTVPCIGLLQELIDSLQELFTTICLESFFLSVALGCNPDISLSLHNDSKRVVDHVI